MNSNEIRGILRFIGVCAFLYVAAFIVLTRWNTPKGPMAYRTTDYYKFKGGSSLQRFTEFDRSKRYDAVIIGSSHAYRGYDPGVFASHGHAAFNLGSSAQTPINTYWLVRELLDSSNAPLLIMDVYEPMFKNSGLESTADLALNQPSSVAAVGMVLSLGDLRGLNFLALRFLSPTNTVYPTDSQYSGLGFVPHMDSVKVEALLPANGSMEFNRAQQRAFEATVALCRERGITLVIASHFARRNRRGTSHEALVRYVQHVTSETGIPYLDFTGVPGINDKYWFYDESHLNLAGARIFTEQLVDSLESLGYFR